MKKKLLMITCVVAVLSSLLTVVATGAITKITAHLNSGITINYNGETQTLKDATGTVLAPISYNGSTYVPVRAVSEIFGENVDWDDATQTIYLGSREKQPVNLTTAIGAGTDYSFKILDAAELTVAGSDAPATFDSGISYNFGPGFIAFTESYGIKHDVAGYETLSFTVWSEVDGKVIIADENGDTITSFDVVAGSITSKEINISGQDVIIFGGEPAKMGVLAEMKFFDPIVK